MTDLATTSAQPSTEAVKLADEAQVYYVAKSELTMHFGPPFDRTTTEAARGISRRLAALRQSPPFPAGDEVERDGDGALLVCTGCGSSRNLDALQAGGAISCCPERKMMTVFAAIDNAQRGVLEEAAKVAEAFVDKIGEPAFAIADDIRAISNMRGRNEP